MYTKGMAKRVEVKTDLTAEALHKRYRQASYACRMHTGDLATRDEGG
jgi:hypothetical protein